MATMTKPIGTERGSDGKFHHGCGQSFAHGAWYAKHALKCDGKPVQKRGRIERLSARRGKTATQTTATRAPRRRRAVHTTPAPAVASGASTRRPPPRGCAADAGRDARGAAR